MISVPEIVASGLCIGCGLCESVSPETLEMALDDLGVERPVESATTPETKVAFINAVCPGLVVESTPQTNQIDPMWGPVMRLVRAYSSDPAVRFKAAAGGVLSGLGRFLLSSKRVDRVLHVAPRSDDPLYWSAQVSTTPEEIMKGAGSRYGPVAPLTPVLQLLETDEPLAVIAKPCDAAAIRSVMKQDPRASEIIRYVLVMACGGASRMTKTWNVVEDHGIDRGDVTHFRHRGYGNPGRATATATDGRSGSNTYKEMWEDEGTWDLQWRCKVCPDGMGEVADIVGLDCWEGGAPVGEDPGYDAVIVRTPAGADLFDAAISSGAITVDGDDLDVHSSLENWQPHQSRRKAAVRSRLTAMEDAGLPLLRTDGLRLDIAEQRLSSDLRRAERDGALLRIEQGRNI